MGWARVSAPAWLWGGKPKQLFENAAYKMRPTPDGQGQLIRPFETYSRTRPDLIQFARIAGSGVTREDWDFLDSMADDDTLEDARSQIARHIDRLEDRAGDSLTGMVAFYQLRASAVPSAAVAEQSRLVLESIREVNLSETSEPAFPQAGVYAIRRSAALLHRVKLASVLLRVQHDPRLRSGDISEVLALRQGSENAFAASSGLHMGYYLLDQYISPIIGALTPGIWGFAAHRGFGPVIYSFGRPVAGSSGLPPELLRTLSTRGASSVTEFRELGPEAIPSALSWWSERLNALFGVITDPSVFADGAGLYQPALHLQAVLTVEQIFSRVLSIQANHHDTNARRVLLFTVMDSIESLTGRPIEKNCDLAFARKTLAALTAGTPESARKLLLPRAEAGVRALRALQDGFFLREPDGTVLLRPSVGQRVGPERAVAEYMKLLRNATHGHGAIKDAAIEPTESLLARHDGEIPHDLALLAWLYLLDLLARPDTLRRLLTARSHRYVSPS